MHHFWILLPAFAFLVDSLSAFRSGADDAMWELRWRSLDDRERASIAAAGRTKDSRASLEERGELDLAEGFDRRERRRRAYVQLPVVLVILALLVFTLAGVLPESDLDLVLALAATLLPAATWLRDQQIERAHRAPPESETAVTSR